MLKAEVADPGGQTLPLGGAAKMLGVSGSTLKRRASEWGLRTFWDKRGRRYALCDIRACKAGTLEKQKPEKETAPLRKAAQYFSVGGYSFRIFRSDRGGTGKGYLGLVRTSDIDRIAPWLLSQFGEGYYFLKLLDEEDRMTDSDFWVEAGPSKRYADTDWGKPISKRREWIIG